MIYYVIKIGDLFYRIQRSHQTASLDEIPSLFKTIGSAEGAIKNSNLANREYKILEVELRINTAEI
jgi:hypothetical protein